MTETGGRVSAPAAVIPAQAGIHASLNYEIIATNHLLYLLHLLLIFPLLLIPAEAGIHLEAEDS